MSECLKPKKWEEIRAMSFKEICTLPCLEIVDEQGEPRERFGMFLMVPTTQFIQTQCDFKGGLSNTNWQTPELESTETPTCSVCGKECASEFGLKAHMRSHK